MIRKLLLALLIFIFPLITFAATINGNLTVLGTTTLGSPLPVSSGGTGVTAGKLAAGESRNCGIAASGGVFTISQANGTALSATQPCKVGIKSSTGGQVVEAVFTSNVTFTFGATSDTDGNLFGLTDLDWASVMPFFIGVIDNNGTDYFTISRVPSYVAGSLSTALCQKGDIDCDAQKDVMILTTGLTLSSWVNLPITQVGWFQMTYTTSGSAWTATTSVNTGFNQDYEKIAFTFPPKQMGAGSGTNQYTVGNGPIFSSSTVGYHINRSGRIFMTAYMTNATNGSDGNPTQLSLPYLLNPNTEIGSVEGIVVCGGSNLVLSVFVSFSQSVVQINYHSSLTAQSITLNNIWSGGASDSIILSISGNVVE